MEKTDLTFWRKCFVQFLRTIKVFSICQFEVRHLPPLKTFCLPTSDFLLFVGVETFTSALISLLIWRSVTQVAGFVDLYVIWEDFWREDCWGDLDRDRFLFLVIFSGLEKYLSLGFSWVVSFPHLTLLIASTNSSSFSFYLVFVFFLLFLSGFFLVLLIIKLQIWNS